MKNTTARWLIASFSCLFLATGCATKGEVEQIVGSSNKVLMEHAIAAERQALLRETEPTAAIGDAAAKSRADALARIDAFIADHADDKAIVNALYIRKAFLHLAGGEHNMASAAFAHFDPELPGSERDYGLYLASDVLVWWTQIAGTDQAQNREAFTSKAQQEIKSLDAVNAKLPKGSAIRYYLAAIRAEIVLKVARFETDKRPKLREGMKAYCAEFDATAQQYVRAWDSEDMAGMAKIPLDDLRPTGDFVAIYQKFRQEYIDNQKKLGESGDPKWDPDCAWLDTLKKPAQ